VGLLKKFIGTRLVHPRLCRSSTAAPLSPN
jgi:hypothetical protein